MVQNKTNTYNNLPSSPPDLIVKQNTNNRANERQFETASEFRPTIVERATFAIDISEVGIIRKYKIEISKKSDGTVKKIEIDNRNDFIIIQRQRLLQRVLSEFITTGRFPGKVPPGHVVFDRKEYIYTPHFLDKEVTSEIEFGTIQNVQLRDELGSKTELLIMKLTLQKEFAPAENEQNEDLLRETKRFLYFLVQSQAYLRGYFVTGGAIYEANYESAFKNGKVFKNGFILSVEEASAGNDKHNFTLQITPLKKLFRQKCSLPDYISDVVGADKADMNHILQDQEIREQLLKDISGMLVSSLQNKTYFGIHGLQKSNEITFFEKSIEPELVTIPNYITMDLSGLQYPDLPLIVRQQNDNKVYYPIENLVVPMGQIVKPTLFNLDLIHDSINEGQLLPHAIKKLVKEFKMTMLGAGNKFLNAFNVRIAENMTKIQANIMIPPIIVYDWETISPIYTNVTDPSLSWNVKPGTPFENPATLNKWAILILDQSITKEECISFVFTLRKTAYQHRMLIDTESYLMSNTLDNVKDLRRQAKELKDENVELLIIVADCRDSKTDGLLKTIEVTTGIATHLFAKEEVLQLASGKGVTQLVLPLQQINAKCNVINFALDVARGMCRDLKSKERLISKSLKRMYVGISIANGDAEKPTGIGLAFTTSSLEEQKSIIWYQSNKSTCIIEIASKVVDAIHEYNQSTRFRPDEIVIFRKAVKMETRKLEDEFEKIVQGIEMMNSTHRPTTTMVSVVTESNPQFLRYKLPDIQSAVRENVTPGTIVDCQENDSSFYLTSSKAEQGTLSSVKFSVIGTKTGSAPLLSMNELKWITNALAYANQFANSPGPVPSILTAADCVSSRALLAAKLAINEQLLNIPGNLKRRFEDVGSNDYYKEVTKQLKSYVEGRHW